MRTHAHMHTHTNTHIHMHVHTPTYIHKGLILNNTGFIYRHVATNSVITAE